MSSLVAFMWVLAGSAAGASDIEARIVCRVETDVACPSETRLSDGAPWVYNVHRADRAAEAALSARLLETYYISKSLTEHPVWSVQLNSQPGLNGCGHVGSALQWDRARLSVPGVKIRWGQFDAPNSRRCSVTPMICLTDC